MRRHKTGRMCHVCDAELRDSIIHFGEKAPFTPPYNWEEAAEAAKEADLILCLGSSLKVGTIKIFLTPKILSAAVFP